MSMDKRSWPWRRKTTDRSVSPNESFDSSSIQTSSRHIDYQDISTIVLDHSRVADDGSTQWQDYEEKIKVLNDKLSAALMDVASKELLAKQHAKLAEEAVSGWETVEAEAASMKQQLEVTIQQKLATEDRVSHLDGALKECMRQLRNVREEQEESIHNAIMKKTRDWDRLQCELEEKMADLEQHFLEKDAENKAMSRSLVERARTISQISESCATAQAEASMLRVRLESSEKEKVALKYELSVAHKEIEIRNEEKGLSKRAADAANKQHLEDVKKIAKLEAECQRLRSLIRKKLPGPAAIAQMRLEAEGPGIEKTDSRKKNGKGNISPRDSLMQSMQEFTMEDNHQTKEGDLWSDRFSSLEDETKMLREVLTKRNNELQSARLMCARTASKLSAVEQQLEALNSNQGKQRMPVVSGLETQLEKSFANSGEPSLASVSEDGNDGEVSCAESWATALIAELDQFKKEKLMPAGNETSAFALKSETDYFMEMEQLVGLSPRHEHSSKERTFWEQKEDAVAEDSGKSAQKVDGNLAKEVENQDDACKLCEEFHTRLAAAEKDLAQKAADQTSLVELKRKLTLLFEEGAADVDELWEKLREDIELPENLSKSCLPADRSSTLPANANPLAKQDGSSYSLDPNSVLHGVVLELTTAVCKVVSLVKDLAVSNPEDQFTAATMPTVDANDAHIASAFRNFDFLDDGLLKTDDLDAKYHSLTEMSNHFTSGKLDLLQLMRELSSILSHIARVKTTQNGTARSSSRKSLSFKSSTNTSGETSGEMELIGLGSPMSDTSKSECSEAAAKIVPADESVQSFRKDCFSSEILRLEEELRKAQAERIALETHMKADYRRFSDIEEELFQLKLVKGELETCVAKDQEEIQQLRGEKFEAEQRLGSLQTQLNSAESSKELGKRRLSDMAAVKDEAESQLRACKSELEELRLELNALGKELFHKEQKNSELEGMCKDLKEELETKSSLSCPKCSRDAAKDEQLCRELEIAAASEKLAECERTILVLGQQLKALASPKGSDSYEAIQNSFSLAQASFDSPQGPSSTYSSTSHDNAFEISGSVRFSEPQEDFIAKKGMGRLKKDSPWDPRASIASDILDSELISLAAMPGQASGRRMFDMFGDRVPVHEDYIEAVAQMPSSPETEPILPKRVASKPPRRKKRSPQSFVGVNLSKSMNDACSPSAEKHGSSFSRFFSRTKSSY
ncbi:hypothetical protein GOP47_0020247 [Adiantum capillus-veneris]|uniref:Filament-like plant protein n=1 Tax=Adiantum capillus-veneris TaxID=13818 RepID=A0A9D4UD46_ADICA|nr:hypothetical protein GOP47_0020247 [Adiantum capillus-veneris]